MCKSNETKEVLKNLKNIFNIYGVLEETKWDRGCAFLSNDYKMFFRKKIDTESSPPRLHTITGRSNVPYKRSKHLTIANLEHKTGLDESINRAM